jgi:hypothetical protein
MNVWAGLRDWNDRTSGLKNKIQKFIGENVSAVNILGCREGKKSEDTAQQQGSERARSSFLHRI